MAIFANERRGLLIMGITNNYPKEFFKIPDLENKRKELHKTINWYCDFKSIFYKVRELQIKEGNCKHQILVLIIAQTKDIVGVKQSDQSIFFPYCQGPRRNFKEYHEIVEDKKLIRFENTKFLKEIERIIH